MTNEQAAEVLRRIWVLLPTAKQFWQKNTAAPDRKYVFDRWLAALEPYSLEEAEEALLSFVHLDPEDANAKTYPVQTLIARMDARRPRQKPKQDITPACRDPRESNLAEIYAAAVAVKNERGIDDARQLINSMWTA